MYLRNYVFMSKGIKMKSESNQIILSVKGLHCANCASKIERKINEMNEVEKAHIDIIGEKILIETKETNSSILINPIQKIADSIEEGVKIFLPEKRHFSKENSINVNHNHSHSHSHTHKHSDKNSYKNNIRKTMITLGLGVAIYILASFSNNIFSSFTTNIFSMDILFILKIFLFLVSYIIIGGNVLLKAIKNIKKGQIFDENFLMAIATVGAFAIGEYHEAVAVMFFYQVGELFQEIAVNNSRKSIASLMNIRPDYANIKRGDTIEKVAPEEVNIGDFIIVKAGEKVPLDGIIVDGNSTFDTSALTGEALPKEKGINDEIFSE